MSNQNPTEEVETELEMAERVVLQEKYEAFALLHDDSTEAGKAFKVLIRDGYIKDKAVEFTSLLAVPAMQNQRSQLFEALASISHFENYLLMVSSLGAPVNEDEE